MRTIQENIYTFDELNDKAKEKARNWYREHDEYDSCFVLDDFVTICGILGITLATHKVRLVNGKESEAKNIYYSGFYSQGDGACFEGTYAYAADAVEKIKEHAPQDETLHKIALGLDLVQSRMTGKLSATIKKKSHLYNHERSVEIEVFEEREDNEFASESVASAVEGALKDLMRWLYQQLRNEYTYRNSDEQVDESIRCNEYEFYSTGEIYHDIQ